MPNLIKPALLGLGLVAGIALSAQAQTAMAPTPGPSVATLPPAQGPRASSYLAIPSGEHVAVTPSPAYVGPAPGAGTGNCPPRFDGAGDGGANPKMRPSAGGRGPGPNKARPAASGPACAGPGATICRARPVGHLAALTSLARLAALLTARGE